MDRHSCKECKRRRIKCTRDIPVCGACNRFSRHCLYEKHSRTPLTRKNLTAVEEELSICKEMLRKYVPDVDVSKVVAKLKNGYSVSDLMPKQEVEETMEMQEGPGQAQETQTQTQTDTEPQIQMLSPNEFAFKPEPKREPGHIDFSQFQIPQLLPSTITGTKPKAAKTYVSPEASYNWDERKQGEFEPTIIDGMATTDSNSYLGAASSAALINLVGGGFFLYDKKQVSSPGRSSSSSVHKAVTKSKLEHYIHQYFNTYHISYPIIHKPMFMAQFNEIIPQPDTGWDSLLYIVAAIGSFMSSVSPDENDDLTLFELAKSKLSIEHLETGNITLVQTLTLMSNYLQKRDRPNSGYNYLGLAVRMALGLGLHKQIDDTNESVFTQELKRRVWWCLYIFDCGQTITYGRPLGIPCSGIDARLPLNIPDTELTAKTSRMPDEQLSPTIYTSLRLQSLFHLLTNCIYERIITDPFPSSQDLIQWDEQYLERWRSLIPDYFKDEAVVPTEYKLARAVLGWRFSNLRIIMYRTFLLKNVVVNSKSVEGDYDSRAGEICLQECSETIRTMSDFWATKPENNRMDAWYSLYFLIPAVLMPLVCLRNNPSSYSADTWRSDISVAKRIIQKLMPICPSAGRILNLIDSLGAGYLTEEREEGMASGTDESPFSQLLNLHSMLWPGSFDIEQQFL